MPIDYTQEVMKLEKFTPGSNSEFWKPKDGQYHIVALGELEDTEPYKEEGKEPKPRVKIEILLDDKKYIWTIPKGQTPASTYGQLCRLAKSNGNRLKDIGFLVVVQNNGKRNTYTIVKV